MSKHSPTKMTYDALKKFLETPVNERVKVMCKCEKCERFRSR